MNQTTNRQGFTIIEVVLVLAIAALIFLMIFVALPALQKGQRDTARKQDANTVAAGLGTYRSNHSGNMPDGIDEDFISKYASNLSQVDNVTENDEPPAGEYGLITVELGETCDGDSSSRAAAVRVRLEASNDVVCTDG